MVKKPKKGEFVASDTPNMDSVKVGMEKNYVVRTSIQRLDKGVGKMGRPRKFTPTRMRNGINKYFCWCEENDRVPSIKGMMIFLKMYKDQFYQYLEYPEFKEIMEQSRQVILEWCEQDIYRTPGPAAGKIAYMKNVHDWSEKITQDTHTTVTKVISVEEAQAKIAALAPLLLEQLRGATLAQLGNTAQVVDITEVTDVPSGPAN